MDTFPYVANLLIARGQCINFDLVSKKYVPATKIPSTWDAVSLTDTDINEEGLAGAEGIISIPSPGNSDHQLIFMNLDGTLTTDNTGILVGLALETGIAGEDFRIQLIRSQIAFLLNGRNATGLSTFGGSFIEHTGKLVNGSTNNVYFSGTFPIGLRTIHPSPTISVPLWQLAYSSDVTETATFNCDIDHEMCFDSIYGGDGGSLNGVLIPTPTVAKQRTIYNIFLGASQQMRPGMELGLRITRNGAADSATGTMFLELQQMVFL